MVLTSHTFRLKWVITIKMSKKVLDEGNTLLHLLIPAPGGKHPKPVILTLLSMRKRPPGLQEPPLCSGPPTLLGATHSADSQTSQHVRGWGATLQLKRPASSLHPLLWPLSKEAMCFYASVTLALLFPFPAASVPSHLW